ncbi:CRISPR-associated helicase, Cas3 family [Clostridium sp. DSM 8431]|uniref:CRISPR-associated helicase/endonuclease Cas3 n=1 Tax=Clostridium sp. DSM 8431 TaxID=1761781 RepID=UPI0008E1C869|nr:CRISPR-associated helicase/endonuclease Cas3 [Clostridium sp. DSM 8431]SFU77995.1 CRISPR-associated helicase, Cas3 family [Clostridium sp. DSM 8431]
MYFNLDETVNIDRLLNKKYDFYAHLKDENKETLKEHTDLTFSYFLKLFKEKSLKYVFLNIEKKCLKEISSEGIQLFRKMLLNIPVFHDMGKINPNFQIEKMKNTNVLKEAAFQGSEHSLISSIIYLDYYIEEIKNIVDKNEKKLLRTFLFINAYIISKHHSDLDSIKEYFDKFAGEDYGYGKGFELAELFLNKYKNVYLKDFSTTPKRLEKWSGFTEKFMKSINKEIKITLYIYSKLIFSLLVASDYYAASEFMSNVKINNLGDINVNRFVEKYKNSDLYKAIRKYEQKRLTKEEIYNANEINVLRSEMFLDSEKEILKNYSNDLFFLEAPTGSGKSNTALNLSFTLIKKNRCLKKIFYVYPFNTLVEQNLNLLKDIFSDKEDIINEIAVINSIYPIKRKRSNLDKENIEEALLDRQFLNYPMILTTHVSLFDILFGNTKESNFAFYSLIGSVVVLDEIQSYKNIIWSEIMTFFNSFCEVLNMKIIIMSATLPDLKSLIYNNSSCISLIKDRKKYFNHPLFKDRVKVNYDLLKESDVYDKLIKHVIKNSECKKKILVEFITKESAYRFYENIKNEVYLCELITGDDNILERKRILDKLNGSEVRESGIVLVSTQVIEAGVDIDMDIGYKDISKLDSEEQFMGRINRSCRKSGVVYFFYLDKEDRVYKNDIRVDKSLTLINDNIKKYLENKDFKSYYDLVLDILRKNFNNNLDDFNLENFFCNTVGSLDFINIQERMKLIDDDDYDMSVFLNRIIKDKENIINGNDIWQEYKELLKSNMNYAEKKIRLSEVRSLMNYFIYKIRKNENLCYNDRIGDLIYIEDGEDYFKDFKLDKKKFIQDTETFI